MTPESVVTNSVLFSHLELLYAGKKGRFFSIYEVKHKLIGAVCLRCGNFSLSGYDKRLITVQDAPIRGKTVVLKIHKRRYYCRPCKRVFSESIEGIMPRRRTTQRFRRSLLWACENFTDLKRVRRAYNCSNGLIFKILYEQLEMKLRERAKDPWPRTVGIDEHHFKRAKGVGKREFVSMFVDYNNKRLKEVVHGKTHEELWSSLEHIEGRENVRNAICDLADSYKSFIQGYFPNAEIIADKFHVLRLLTPAINRRRKEITGDKRTNPVRKLLLRNAHNLQYYERTALQVWLNQCPELKEIYEFKEAMHRFYRIRGYHKASHALERMIEQMRLSNISEIKTLRRTLEKWKNQILNYFKFRLTNARTEGYNNVAKVIKRRSYGFKNFKHYRLRLLSACC
jgi:transposase